MARKRSRNTVAQAAAAVVPAANGLVARAQYDVAGHGRRMRGWRAPSSGPNRAAAGLETIRNRSRDAVRNEWAGAASERVWGTNLVGTGIIARPNSKDPALKALFTEIWNDFCATADADGVLDFYGLQTLAVEAWRTSGEVFIRFRPRRADDGLRVPLQIQLLESDIVPQLDADAWPGLPAGSRIRSGIELDRIGRRAAYWCYREHPGDSPTSAVSHSDLYRVPATEMRHLFKPNRPGALRGVPASAAVLPKLRSVGNFDDAVLVRQELANLYTVFVTRPPETGAPAIDPTTGQPYETDPGSGGPMIGLEPGISQELAPGEDVKFSDPPDAGANYPDFMRQQHLGVASGSGTPYELLTGDVRDVSDRTLRIVINEFRRTCEQYQWQLIIPMFCQPVRDAVARAAVLAGLLTPEQGRDFARCTWSPHAWPYIHPTQDVQAKKMEKEAGFKSRSQIIAERGDDAEQVDADRAEDLARETRLGIAPPIPKGPADA
ncbi:Phage portal protein, lambda family [Aromatoleum aromaticum EbN1]|uniref:Phage portal protein, lambda family n=1 Tax=Aromatoleum aromaticum (strain DSM 19018 / LMG 30748 / EbN1) TaxID=76114 RepID=Q5NXH1_AROAE|nr:phage portal protein [Aromatoleum aromaticum]CAI10243.1 Phage portal protein, lambda family [Aromatoleum aromaticum EbN1]